MKKDDSMDELGALAFEAQIHSIEEQLTSLQRYYDSKTYEERVYLVRRHNSFSWEKIFFNWDLESRVFEPELMCDLDDEPLDIPDLYFFDPDYFPGEIESITGELDAISIEHFKIENIKEISYSWSGWVDPDSRNFYYEIDDFLRVFFR